MFKRHFKYIVTAALSFSLMLTPLNSYATVTSQSESADIEASDILEVHAEPLPEIPEIIATSAVVVDAETGAVLYDKNKDRKMYPASITKILTAMLAIEEFSPEDEITFSENAVKKLSYNSSSIGARPDEIFTVDQTLHALMLMSANEAATAIAEAHSDTVEAFADAMNTRAQSLGAVNSSFSNAHGLHDVNHYTTAYDMALITGEAIKSDYFLEIMSHTMYTIEPTNKCDEPRYLAQKHSMLSDKKDMRIHREDVIAGKQGYITESGFTLVTVAGNNERTLIVVVLDSTNKGLYQDTEKLIEYGYIAPMPKIEEVDSDDAITTVVATAAGMDSSDDDNTSVELIKQGAEQTEQSGVHASDVSEDTEADEESPLYLKVLMWLVIIGVLLSAVLIFDQRRSRRARARRAKRHKNNLKIRY